ncbi:hypothetical protein M413DRAFT_445136 [Hebeloma cylindrosporum]|uniref:Uncharacterized protein n=1 Tax=Hebeloma cylindrosporum TaxID=76867 RepID=A0A0C2YLM6_HEBCY|nr:hypothetical protein M413DRAFT_445136 [Hebeloma cylindrosporum h7]
MPATRNVPEESPTSTLTGISRIPTSNSTATEGGNGHDRERGTRTDKEASDPCLDASSSRGEDPSEIAKMRMGMITAITSDFASDGPVASDVEKDMLPAGMNVFQSAVNHVAW